MAEEDHDPAKRESAFKEAELHLEHAQTLFDGEHLEGEAWARVWRGRVALDRGRLDVAIKHLDGAAHGPASIAASLYLGEAYLKSEEHPMAQRSFERCRAQCAQKRLVTEIVGQRRPRNVDAGWGDELPVEAVMSRTGRGLAEAEHMAPGDWQDRSELDQALLGIKEATKQANAIRDRTVRDRCLALCLESETRVLRAQGQYEDALKKTKEWIRLRPGPAGFMREAELLDLLIMVDGQPDDSHQLRIAAEIAWGQLEQSPSGPRGSLDAREVRSRLRRAVRKSQDGT
jgi:tetratricopeptide (TPR) repeat protein